MKLIERADDVTTGMLTVVANCVDDYYIDSGIPPVDEFIDRLCDEYGNADGWDIENLDTPAVRKIMRHARSSWREAQ